MFQAAAFTPAVKDEYYLSRLTIRYVNIKHEL
jgi:hypothetical protein